MPSLWMLVAGLMFACMGALVKFAAIFFSNVELVFYRSLVGVIATFVFMQYSRMPFSTDYWKIHCWRGLFGLGGVLLFFYCILQLPLATALSLNNTWPLFLVFLAMFFLKKDFSWLLAGAVAVGFIGVLLLLQPTLDNEREAWYAALAGAGSGLLASVAHLNISQLSARGEPEWRIVFYFTLLCTGVTGLWLLFSGFSPVNAYSLLLALGIGITATLAQLALSRAHRGGNVIIIGALSYSAVLFAGLLDTVIWDTWLPMSAWLGMGLIVLGGFLCIWRMSVNRLREVVVPENNY